MTRDKVYRKPRIVFFEKATIWAARQSMVCRTVNLSETGLLLIPPFSSEPGLSLRVDIPLPGLERPLALPAILVREGEHEGEYAWGVKFELVSADAQKILGQFLQEQVAIQFADQTRNDPQPAGSEPRLEDLLPGDVGTTDAGPQAVIMLTEPMIQPPPSAAPSRLKHKPIVREAARRVPVKRRATGSQPAVVGEGTGPHQLPPEDSSTSREPGSQPVVAPMAPPSPRVPAYSGPLSGAPPPVTAPQIVPGDQPALKKTTTGPQRVPAYTGPITGSHPAVKPGTGSHPVVSPGTPAAPPVSAPPAQGVAASDEPQLSVTMPAELLVDRPVQEEGTPDFDDVPEWSDKSDVPRPGKDVDLMAETDKVVNKLDDIYKDAIKQLDYSDAWASGKKKKKKKKGWF